MAVSTVDVGTQDVSALIVAHNVVASQFICNATFSGQLSIGSGAVLSSTLTVASQGVFSGPVGVAGSATVSGTLSVTSAVMMSSTLAITSAVVLSGSLDVESGIVGSSTLSVASGATFSDSVGIAGTLDVTGAIAFNDVRVSGTLSVLSAVALSANLIVTDSALFSATVQITDSAVLSANITVADSALISGSLQITGSATFSGPMLFANSALYIGSAIGFFSVGAISQFSAISTIDISAMSADGVGVSVLASGGDIHVITTEFRSPAGGAGTFYFKGFYNLATSDVTFESAQAFGTASGAHQGHIFVVTGNSAASDVPLVISGALVSGGITTVSTETINVPAGSPSNTYVESTKFFVGTVTITSAGAASGIPFNYGNAKYWDFGDQDFVVKVAEAIWLCGQNDTGANIELLHHRASGWTYNAGAVPTIPSAVTGMVSVLGTNTDITNGEQGAFKNDAISTFVQGNTSEGIFWKITTTANAAFELGQAIVIITHDPPIVSAVHTLGMHLNAVTSALAAYGFTSGN